MKLELIKKDRLRRRVARVRRKVVGTTERPRLAVSRFNKNIYAQIIDDGVGKTLCAVSTQSKDVRVEVGYGGNVKAAKLVGARLAEKAKALGISEVCFDRRGRSYHGRLKALAEAAREAGLKF